MRFFAPSLSPTDIMNPSMEWQPSSQEFGDLMLNGPQSDGHSPPPSPRSHFRLPQQSSRKRDMAQKFWSQTSIVHELSSSQSPSSLHACDNSSPLGGSTHFPLELSFSHMLWDTLRGSTLTDPRMSGWSSQRRTSALGSLP